MTGGFESRTSCLLSLPPELVVVILEYLPLSSYISLCLTHSFFEHVLQDDYLWRSAIISKVLSESSFSSSSVIPVAGHSSEAAIPLDALFHTCRPYNSYRQLYSSVIKEYGWMIGTWAGNCQWTGSLMEVYYNPETGCIDCRRLQPWAFFGPVVSYSLDHDVGRRDFDAVLEARTDCELIFGKNSKDKQKASMVRLIGISDTFAIDSIGRQNSWPTHNVPAYDRVLVAHVDALSKLGNGFDSFSNDLLAISRPIIRESIIELPGIPPFFGSSIPQHRELFYRIPKPVITLDQFRGYSGLFMGDYSSHGPEILFLYHPTATSLHAVKITGDPNIPRGELSWIVEDLTTPSRLCTESEWPGARAYKGKGQISAHGFSNPTWIETEIIFYSVPPRSPSSISQNMRSHHSDHDLHFPPFFNRRGSTDSVSPSEATRGLARGSRPEMPGIAMWWKDMVHLSHFHKIEQLSSSCASLLSR